MTWESKEALTAKIAHYSAELLSIRFSGIGNLFRDQDTAESMHCQDAGSPGFAIGRIVSMQFFWGDHFTYDIPRGPFSTSAEWLLARLQLQKNGLREGESKLH